MWKAERKRNLDKNSSGDEEMKYKGKKRKRMMRERRTEVVKR